MTRDEALALMQEHTQSPSLRQHMLAVEAVMRAYAAKFGEDPEAWGRRMRRAIATAARFTAQRMVMQYHAEVYQTSRASIPVA